MEYSLRLTVSPTDESGVMMARVFINAKPDDEGSETVEIWHQPLILDQPITSQDPLHWASHVIGKAWEKCFIAWAVLLDQGTAKPMSYLFEQQNS